MLRAMGWLIRYTGDDPLTIPDGGIEGQHAGETVKKGDLLDVRPVGLVRLIVRDPDQPWERIAPNHPDYIAPADR